ncbi:MAG: peptide methionine sulfoxide reductase MsrA [Phycisphaeraceae bacterium]|nr:MAG: peptide methionine sulfoxide reductase MsrA [Phycisphaeraceae bacterium]
MTRLVLAFLLVALVAVTVGLAKRAGGAAGPESSLGNRVAGTKGSTLTQTVEVKVFDTAGELVGPVPMAKVVRTDAEWREVLTEEQYRILRKAGTEAAFCGTLLDNKTNGVYSCAGCGLPMFSSETKFKSGTGWPSFYAPVSETNIVRHEDTSFGMVRTEIECARCGGHLGHVFNDGPAPTGERHCLNSESLSFTAVDDVASLGEVAEAVFAGGCFWCVEAVFEEINGVLSVESGYTGGSGVAKYDLVLTGNTGHAEAVRIVFDPERVSYEDLLRVHFETHDPTTLNRQGADVGTQYRSGVYYTSETQNATAKAYIEKLTKSGKYERPIVTEVQPLDAFHTAEGHHQDYVKKNPNQGYVRAVAKPKVDKVRKNLPELTKPDGG